MERKRKGEGKEEGEGRGGSVSLTQLCFSELPQKSTQIELTPSVTAAPKVHEVPAPL